MPLVEKSARLLAAGLVLMACSAAPEARAQEGVAGDVPMVSKPNTEPAQPADLAKQAQIKVTTTLVTAPVTVIGKDGKYVYDLQEIDFEVLDNGVPQHLERFDMEMHPVALVIVVEANDEVAALLDPLRKLGPLFSQMMLGKMGSAAVVTYSDRIKVAQDFSDDSDQLESALRELKSTGRGYRLNDALARAVAMLEQRPKGEKRVIVGFSEGREMGSQTTKEDVVQRATNAEVAIYGLGFNPAKALLDKKSEPHQYSVQDANVTRPLPPNSPHTPTMSDNVYSNPVPPVPILLATGEIIRSTLAKSLLEFYAGYTGGVFYSHWSNKAVEGQLSRIAEEIGSQYELAYVPDNLSQMGFHRIVVQVKRRGVKVRTRAGYFYQPGATSGAASAGNP